MTIESELKKAFKNAGYGNVDVEIQKWALRAGYQVETEAQFWIKITRSKLTKKDTSKAAGKLYRIVRRKRTQ